MRIGVEAVGNRAGGGAMVLLDTLIALLNEPVVSEVVLYCSPDNQRGFDLPRDGRLRVVRLQGPDGSALQRIMWLESGLPKRVLSDRLNRLLLMNGVGHAGSNCASIAFVQQSIPLTREVLVKAKPLQRFRLETIGWLTKRGTLRATRVGVQRLGMQKLLAKRFKIALGKIDIFEPGFPPFPPSDDPAGKIKAMEITPVNQRILYVGSNEPHKNLAVAISATASLRKMLPSAKLFATCASLSNVDDHSGIAYLGFLNRAELRRAYELASVLIMPSLAESLGLPLLEAMGLKVPVVAADLEYARDVCGSAALYFNPYSPEDAAAKLLMALNDAETKQGLIDAGLDRMSKKMSGSGYRQMARRLIELS